MKGKENKLGLLLKELKEPEAYPGYLLWQASNIWNRNIKKYLKRFGTTHVQFVVLSSILYMSKHNENINQKQIARHSKLGIMMISDVLKVLESKKLIARLRNQKDKRHNTITVTKKGVNLVYKMFIQAELADAEFFKVFEGNIKSFADSLEKLITSNYDDIYFRD
jgi:DNA-binding MarR family transcriptional regulator